MSSPMQPSNIKSALGIEDEMNVLKRNDELETVSFDKILRRMKRIGKEADLKLNYTSLAMKVIDQLYDGISTTKIDELSAEQCASMASIHPDYNILAGRIMVSNHHKNTNPSFIDIITDLYNFKDINGKHSQLVSTELFESVCTFGKQFEDMIVFERDYLIDYFGFKTLERSYLMKINGKTVERPQHMWMRVSIGIHGSNIERVLETYNLMSQKYFTHATPTLFNAGTPRPQLSSCFLQAMESDSIDGIYNTLHDCAKISKWAGGIGLHIHNIRATGSHIRGTNGTSNGIVPMLRVFNNTAKYVDQCLDPDTIVYTKRGPIKIKEIVVGDKVITDDGNFYKIGKILDNDYQGEFYTIDVKHTLYPLKVTDMHPLWVIPSDTESNFDDVISSLDRKLLVPDFIEAKNIKKNDFVGFPIPKYEKDISQYTEEDCRFYGILLGCGEILLPNSINTSVLLNNNNGPTDFVIQYLEKLYIYSCISDVSEYSRFTWTRNNMFKFTYEMIYDENKEKRMMNAMLHLPKNKILQLIKGLIDTIGIITNDQIILNMPSQSISENVCYILLRLSILSEVVKREESGKISYVLIIPMKPIMCELLEPMRLLPSTTFSFFEYNDYLFSIVDTIEFTNDYSGRVIDIEVDNHDHHNFLTHSGLVKNGGGKRNGSFAIYLEPWHADIDLFLEMRKNHGDEELKARDLFYALWIPDLFMERVKSDASWTLMCPDECPGLSDVYGNEFNTLYEKYESDNKGKKTVRARELWFKVLDAQMETGTPYLLYKDACNKKSNQKNLGTIKSSNLCTEIIEYSDDNETAVCNLASIALPTFVDPISKTFDFDKLHSVTKVVTYNLNKVIDVNYYPTEKGKRSNMRHRPIGMGIQGLADTFMMLDMPFASDKAKQMNKDIFETIYHAGLESSCEIAQIEGPYETFLGSPASNGILQYDMWDHKQENNRYNWDLLKSNIKEHGLRNSLLLAPMPTASTSQILGFNECIEPITSNIYSRRTNAGEFIIANKYMMTDLIKLDLWNDKIKNNIIANHGSIQQLEVIPEEIREKYKTVWEIPMRNLIDMAADRGIYICQSQSLNLWLEDPTYSSLTSMHFYSWQKGLKTGIYYLRRRGRHQAQQFTIEPEKAQHSSNVEEEEICEMCSS